jgi:nitrogen fixation protein FixH
MSTFGDMVARIGSELQRSDIDAQIKKAIQTAIEHWGRERFWWNEEVTSWDTVASTRNYSESAATPVAKKSDVLTITVNGSRYQLREKTYAELDAKTVTTTFTGPPTEYAYYESNYYLYPIPDQSYSIAHAHVRAIANVSMCASASQTNAWMTDGEELIRQRAKAIVKIDVLDKPDAKSEADRLLGTGCLSTMERAALLQVRGEVEGRVTSGRIRPTSF